MFCILWAGFLFLEYIYQSSYYLESFRNFKYTDLIITLTLFTGGIIYFISDRKIKGGTIEIRKFRGIYHYLFLLLTMALIMFFFLVKTGISSGPFSSTIVFIFRSILFHLGLGLILLSALSTGSYLLSFFPVTLSKTSSLLVGIALGFFIITFILFLLGAAGLLFQFIVFPLILILIIPGWKTIISFFKESLLKKTEPFRIHSLALLAYVLLILLVALTLAFDTRTIPIGYDSLSLYMNIPKLITGYHGLTQGGDAYNWSLMMSLGFILYNNVTIVILISIVPGILSLIAIYKICRDLNVNINWSIFACAFFYSLPNTIWQSKFDEKTDLALLFISLCSILLFTGHKSAPATINKTKEKPKKTLAVSPAIAAWILCGCLIGFTFGIKYVAMMSIFSFLVVIFYTNAGKFNAAFMFFLNLTLIFALDLTRFAAFQNTQKLLSIIVPLALAIACLFMALKNNRTGVVMAGKKAIVFLVATGITFLPWAIKNIAENKKLSIDSILTGKSPLPVLYPEFEKSQGTTGSVPIKQNLIAASDISENKLSGINPLAILTASAQENKVSQKSNSTEIKTTTPNGANYSTNKEKEEEIRRYLGYEHGIARFISLPYDMVMKINVQLISNDSGILLLILLPLFMFIFSFRQITWNVLKIALLFLILIVSLISVHLKNDIINTNSILEIINANGFTGNTLFRDIFLPLYLFLKKILLQFEVSLIPMYEYLTMQSVGLCFVIISISSIPFYFLYKSRIEGLSLESKTMIAFVFCIVLYWLILSSGIIWYGIVGFSLIPVIIATLVTNDEQSSYGKGFISRYVIICSAVWFILILPFQFMPPKFLYTKDKSNLNFNEIFDVPFSRYAIGALDEKEVQKQFLSQTQMNMVKTLNRDKNSKILNVSTFLNYYIANNDSRVYKDNQLGIFSGIYAQAKNEKSLLAAEFRKNNIRYILVSLKTPEIDRTPDRSLTKKFDDLMRALVNNPEVRLLLTNRIVERPDGDMDMQVNGGVVKAKFEVIGKSVIDPGTDALFEIL